MKRVWALADNLVSLADDLVTKSLTCKDVVLTPKPIQNVSNNYYFQCTLQATNIRRQHYFYMNTNILTATILVMGGHQLLQLRYICGKSTQIQQLLILLSPWHTLPDWYNGQNWTKKDSYPLLKWNKIYQNVSKSGKCVPFHPVGLRLNSIMCV